MPGVLRRIDQDLSLCGGLAKGTHFVGLRNLPHGASSISISIKKANRLRKIIARLRKLAYGIVPVPAASLELLIAEMIVIHFCSDSEEAIRVLEHFLETVKNRVKRKEGILAGHPYRVTWVNPVADLKMMNILEELGGCIAGTEYLFSHALDLIPEDKP